MANQMMFDCPICEGHNQLRAIQRNLGQTIAYACRACGEKFVPEDHLSPDYTKVILLAKHANPDYAKAASSTDFMENLRLLSAFREAGGKQFLETYKIGEESLPA